jgi:hypothetical protein
MKFLHATGLNVITGDYACHNIKSFGGKDPMKLLQCLAEISEITARTYIKEDNYERIILSEEVPDIHKAHYYNLQNVYKLWKENYPCNILYTGPDIIFMKDISFSDKFTNFSMFNYANYNMKSSDGFKHFLSCDLRYFPSTMDEESWTFGLGMAEHWPRINSEEAWNYEGIIYNKILWSQEKIELKDILYPSYCYSYRLREIDDNNIENKLTLKESQCCTINSSGKEHILYKLEKLSELELLDPQLVTKLRSVFIRVLINSFFFAYSI